MSWLIGILFALVVIEWIFILLLVEQNNARSQQIIRLAEMCDATDLSFDRRISRLERASE